VLSRWQFRKQHRHKVRDAQIEKCKRLEEENIMLRSRVMQLEHHIDHNSSVNNASSLNLERYSEDYSNNNVDDHSGKNSQDIGQQRGYQPYSLTTWVTGAGGSTLQQEVSNPSVMENIVPASEAAVQENVMPKGQPGLGIRTMECNASCVVRLSHQRTHCINIWTKCVCVASCSGRRKAIELTEEDGKLVLASDRLRGVLSPLLRPRHWTQLQMPVAGDAHRLVQYVLLLLPTREQFADGLRKCGENLEAT